MHTTSILTAFNGCLSKGCHLQTNDENPRQLVFQNIDDEKEPLVFIEFADDDFKEWSSSILAHMLYMTEEMGRWLR